MKNLINLVFVLFCVLTVNAQNTIQLEGESKRISTMKTAMDYYISEYNRTHTETKMDGDIFLGRTIPMGKDGKEVFLSANNQTVNLGKVFVSDSLQKTLYNPYSDVSVSNLLNSYCKKQKETIMNALNYLIVKVEKTVVETKPTVVNNYYYTTAPEQQTVVATQDNNPPVVNDCSDARWYVSELKNDYYSRGVIKNLKQAEARLDELKQWFPNCIPADLTLARANKGWDWLKENAVELVNLGVSIDSNRRIRNLQSRKYSTNVTSSDSGSGFGHEQDRYRQTGFSHQNRIQSSTMGRGKSGKF